jgi:Ca2+-binding EF-hand superfamily protein
MYTQRPSSSYFEQVELFREFDVDGNGLIDASEFREVMQRVGIEGPNGNESVQAIFDKLDVNGSGTLDYAEFVAKISGWKKDASEEAPVSLQGLSKVDATVLVFERMREYAKNHGSLGALQLFRQLDADHSGSIDAFEFKTAVGLFGIQDATDEIIEAVIASIDSNGDGSINYSEFSSLLSSHAMKSFSMTPSMHGDAAVEALTAGDDEARAAEDESRRLAEAAANSEAQENARQAEFTAQAAEEARLAELAAQDAENARQAEFAAQTAEKARQAEQATQEAEEARQAEQAIHVATEVHRAFEASEEESRSAELSASESSKNARSKDQVEAGAEAATVHQGDQAEQATQAGEQGI